MRKHSAESIIFNTIPMSSLKDNVSLIAEGGRIEKAMTSPQMLMHAEIQNQTTLVTEETGLLEDPTYECLSQLENQCEEKLTTCSVSTKNSYECTILTETFKPSAFLATVTGDTMVAFATDHHFDRQVMTGECSPILRTFRIRDSLVSLRENTSTIKLSHNKPCPGLSPHCQNNVALTRFHLHGQRVVSTCRNGLSHLHDCLNSRTRSWISCTSVYLGLHQFSPHMDCSLAWLYSSIS